MKKIWNGKILGIPGALFILFSIIFEKLISKITTLLLVNNIKISGKNVKILSGVRYRYPEVIKLEDNVIIGNNTELISEAIPNHFLTIEEGASIGNDCKIDFTGGVHIKRHAHIAHNVLISTHDHGFDYKSKPIGKKILIEENAFIGSNSFILHNVNYIGKNAVIGTGAVVTKDVPDFAIVVGNPGKIIKYVK